MRLQALLLLFLSLFAHVKCLYFYLDPGDRRCFYEELPNDTVVVGHYMAEVWDREKQHFIIRDDLGIQITVKEVKEDHLVTSSMGPSEGKFAFTSHEAGDHSICLSTKLLNGSGYKPSPDDHEHQVRMHLDIIIGEAKPDNKPADRQHITDLAGRVRDLNDKLRDIRKEQQFQREREAEFRDASERANSRAVFWSLVQGVTLIATCVWQASHLRTFFDHRKIR